MNKLIIFASISCLAASGCSSKPKLEVPECPAPGKKEQEINQQGLSPVVSDNGRFTYLKFGAGQEVPNFTALRIDGGERVVNYTFDPDTRIATVFGIYPAIVLRAGGRVACIRNGAYDPRGPQTRITSVSGDGRVW